MGGVTSGLPLSGQPGKAVGHAVGKLTLRHDLDPVLVLPAAAGILGIVHAPVRSAASW
jgi:hypothetical protein